MFKKALNIENLENIIVSRTDKIGDLVLSIPAFYMLSKMYPKANITILVRNYNFDIVKALPCITKVIAIDSFDDTSLKKEILNIKADAFIALYSDSKVVSLCKESKAKIKVGPLSKLNSFFTYTHGIRQKRSQSVKNEAEYNLDLIRHLNEKLFDSLKVQSQKIVIGQENYNLVDEFLTSLNIKDFLLVHPFTGGSAKNLSIDEYISVLKKLKAKCDIDIVISCVENDSAEAYRMQKALGTNDHVFVSKGSILNLAALIDRSKVFLGASTGPSHIAGNLQKRCVLIYPNKATQSPVRWGLFLNDRASYIIPDKDNVHENYKNKGFDKIDDNIINLIVDKIIEGVNE